MSWANHINARFVDRNLARISKLIQVTKQKKLVPKINLLNLLFCRQEIKIDLFIIKTKKTMKKIMKKNTGGCKLISKKGDWIYLKLIRLTAMVIRWGFGL